MRARCGDALLAQSGALFGKHLRKRGTLARLGGDEFGVLLENCPRIEAERIASASGPSWNSSDRVGATESSRSARASGSSR